MDSHLKLENIVEVSILGYAQKSLRHFVIQKSWVWVIASPRLVYELSVDTDGWTIGIYS